MQPPYFLRGEVKSEEGGDPKLMQDDGIKQKCAELISFCLEFFNLWKRSQNRLFSNHLEYRVFIVFCPF